MKEKSIVNVSEGLRILMEPESWAVQRKRVNSKTDNITWKSEAWFPRLTQALTHCLEQGLSNYEQITLELLRDEFEAIERTMSAYVDSSCAHDVAAHEHRRVTSE